MKCTAPVLQAHHSLFPDDGHAVFHSIDTIRNPAEVVFAQGLLVCIKCAVISACCLKVSPEGSKSNTRQ